MHVTPARRIAAAASSALLLGVTVTAAPALASNSSPPLGSHTFYAIDTPVCSVPKNPRANRCFAMRRVTVAKGTPGAHKFTMPNAVGVGPAGGYTPDDLAAAYGFNPDLPRRSQLVAVVNWYRDPNALADLDVFDHHYGLAKETASSFRVVSQTGGSTASLKPDKDSSGEQSLDIESIRGVCHSCRILLVEAKTPSDANLATAENEAAKLGATEINNSFGEPERKVPVSVQQAYNHPGVVITASTGDAGWYGWDYGNDISGHSQDAAEFPSTSPYVVSVGGTALGLNSDGTRQAEIVWNENGPEDSYGDGSPQGAGGGGCSKYFAAPAWQLHYPGYAAAGCHGKRLAADVSALADPQTGLDVYDSYQGSGWVTTGGTSLAAPLTAAMYALAGGSGGAAYPAASLYVNAAAHAGSVYDVGPVTVDGYAQGNSFCGGEDTLDCGTDVANDYSTTGNHNPNALGAGLIDCSFTHNSVDPVNVPPLSSECNTVKGYDGPTGLGTPKSLRLYEHTNPSVALHAPAVRLHKTATFTAKVSEPVSGVKPTRYVWTWGDGHKSTTTTAHATHAFAKSAHYRVAVTVTDSKYQTVTARRTVTAGEKATIRISYPTKLRRGHTGSFSAARTTVPNTGARIAHVVWSWGDKHSTTGVRAKHHYAKAGRYTLIVKVTDTTGVLTSTRRRITVTS